jgi:hypothetical protein
MEHGQWDEEAEEEEEVAAGMDKEVAGEGEKAGEGVTKSLRDVHLRY